MPTLENALRVHCFDFFNPLDGQRVQVVPRTMRYAGDYKTATGQESSRDASSCLGYLRIIACRHSVFSNQRLVPSIRVQKHPKTPYFKDLNLLGTVALSGVPQPTPVSFCGLGCVAIGGIHPAASTLVRKGAMSKSHVTCGNFKYFQQIIQTKRLHSISLPCV